MFQTILISSLAVLISSWILPGVDIEPWYMAVLVAIVLGVINALVKPLVKLLSLPITVLTLGLFLLVINGLMILLCAHIVPGFTCDGILTGIIYSVILTVVTSVLNKVFD